MLFLCLPWQVPGHCPGTASHYRSDLPIAGPSCILWLFRQRAKGMTSEEVRSLRLNLLDLFEEMLWKVLCRDRWQGSTCWEPTCWEVWLPDMPVEAYLGNINICWWELAQKTSEQAVALGSFSNSYTWNSTVDLPTLTWFAPCHLIIFTMHHSFLGIPSFQLT